MMYNIQATGQFVLDIKKIGVIFYDIKIEEVLVRCSCLYFLASHLT
jgi:hypothetical protein